MFGISNAVNCECEPNAYWFVQIWFSDCIYTKWELVAFCIGMSSVMFWIVAQLPQFVSNLKNQSAEALSPWFLFQWLAGDSFNLLGCLLTGDQLATETFTATYFIFADCIIISQYIYFNMRAKEKLGLKETDQGSDTLKCKVLAEFQEPSAEAFSDSQARLSKITTAIPDLSEELECNDEAHLNCHLYHPVTFVAGRSGASMIAHAIQTPQHPHSPHVDLSDKSSQIDISTTIPPSPETGRSKKGNFRGNHSAHYQGFTPSKGPVRVLLDQADGRGGQFRSITERSLCLAESRKSATHVRKIPDFHVEQLFPTASAMKRHLRRLVNQYGLECGPPTASRLTIHHANSLGKRHLAKQMGGATQETSRLGPRLTKRPVKAAACLASLLVVGTSTNYFQNSGVSGPSQGLAIASRRLLMDGKRHPKPGFLLDRASSTVILGQKLFVICGEGQRPRWLKSFGNCLGWGSSGLYFGSRFSQIAMNYQRKSAEGLSLAMLGCAVLANICMGVSILMRAKSLEDLANKAPWILGSMGTVSLDIFIVLQAKYLDARSTKATQAVPDERTPLLA